MDSRLLIPRLTRKFGRLIAALAASDLRAPIEGVKDQLMHAITQGLKSSGISDRVAADLLGMSRGGYLNMVKRLDGLANDANPSETTMRNRLLLKINELKTFSRKQIETEMMVSHVMLGALLDDLVRAGYLVRSQTGKSVFYSRSSRFKDTIDSSGEFDAMVQIAIQRSPGTVTIEGLSRDALGSREAIEEAVRRLSARGLVQRRNDGWVCNDYALRFENQMGWTAALQDHLDAVFDAMTSKVLGSKRQAGLDEVNGGATFRFEVWPGHPHADELLEQLKVRRGALIKLRDKIEGFNRQCALPDSHLQVTLYLGQQAEPIEAPGADIEATDDD